MSSLNLFLFFFCFSFFFSSFFFQHCDLVDIEGRWTNEWMSSTLVEIYTLNTNLHLFQISFCSRAWFILLFSKEAQWKLEESESKPKGWRADVSPHTCGSLSQPLPLSFLLRGRCGCFRALKNARTINECGHQPACKEVPSLFTARSY